MSAVDGLRKSYFANLFKREEPVGLRSNLPPAGRGQCAIPLGELPSGESGGPGPA